MTRSPYVFFFLQKKLQFLKHIIYGEGVTPDPEKILIVKAWSSPKLVKTSGDF